MGKRFFSHGEQIAKIVDVPTRVSQLINDAEYATQDYVDEAIEDVEIETLTIESVYDENVGYYTISAEDVNSILDRIDADKKFKVILKLDNESLENSYQGEAKIVIVEDSGMGSPRIIFEVSGGTNLGDGVYSSNLIYDESSILYRTVFEDTINKVETINENSNDTQYPSAKAVWDTIKDNTSVTSIMPNGTFTFDGTKAGVYLLDGVNNSAYFNYRLRSTDSVKFESGMPILMVIPNDIKVPSTITESIVLGYMLGLNFGNSVDGQDYLCTKTFTLGTSGSITVTYKNWNHNNTKFLYFLRAGSQSIVGLKTFNSIPEVNSYTVPTSNTQLTAKKYVDDSISTALASIDITKREIVQELPTQDISTKTIYMVERTDPETQNIYDEYMYINNDWEKIGSTEVDLSNYYTKSEIDAMLGDIETILDDILDGALDAEEEEF